MEDELRYMLAPEHQRFRKAAYDRFPSLLELSVLLQEPICRIVGAGRSGQRGRPHLARFELFGRRAAGLQRRAGDIGPTPITLFAAQPDPTTEAYTDVGIFVLPDAGPEIVLPLLDRLAKVVSETSVAGS